MDEKRINLVEPDGIARRVAALRKDMDQIKQRQYIGTDSVRFYKNDTGDPYDWSGELPVSPQASYVGTKILRVTATALTQNVLFADLIAELRVDSNSNPRHTVIDYIDELDAGNDAFEIFFYPDAQNPGAENIQSWTVVINGTDGAFTTKPTNTCFMKAYVVANDDIGIQITELN